MTESKLQEGDVRLDLTYNPLLLQASQVQACGVHVLYLLWIYSGGDKTSVKTLTAYISHNKAKYPINLGAK